ncbi:MAG: type II secretion system protein [Planctomycetota bacterium]|jgi:prepilin-type N-terminal cleavage/methylation domain-containing protein
MKCRKNKTGLTLIEILTSVVIILILASIIVSVTTHIDNQGKKRLTTATMGLLVTALQQFRDYGYEYKNSAYAEFIFPLDCNDFTQEDIEEEMEVALGLTAGEVSISGGTHDDPNFSGSEVMYFLLSQVPECKSTLGRIDNSLVTNSNVNKQFMTITVDGIDYPLLRVVDAWKNTLRYDYYRYENGVLDDRKDSRRNFPLITSAGPDDKFGTADDITSR